MTARDALQPITLTAIVGGILYCRGASDHFVFEGSYEINPFYQRDIDALRAWSPRFLTMLTVNVLFLWTVWSWSISDFDSGLYLIVLGSLLLTELVVHIRHVRNWFLFRTIVRLGGIRGRIEYPRRVMLTMSSLEILSFAGLFTVIFVFTGLPFTIRQLRINAQDEAVQLVQAFQRQRDRHSEERLATQHR